MREELPHDGHAPHNCPAANRPAHDVQALRQPLRPGVHGSTGVRVEGAVSVHPASGLSWKNAGTVPRC